MDNTITIGRGWTSFENYTGDRFLRVADLITFSMHDCEQYATYIFDVKSVICAYSTKGQSVYSGDSGKALTGSSYAARIMQRTHFLKSREFSLTFLCRWTTVAEQ